MRDRGRFLVACAVGVAAVSAMGAVTACNSLSGVDALVVGRSDAAREQDDGTIGEGSSNVDGSPTLDSGVDADATTQGDGPGIDSGTSVDGGGDASKAPDAAADSRSDTSPDAEQDAPGDAVADSSGDSAANGDAADAQQDGTGATGPCDGGTPLVVHSNGFGQTFSDCQPLGTYNVNQAFEACAASTGDAGACSIPAGFTCSGGNLVCAQSGSTCTCWRYDGHPGSALALTTGCNCLPNSAPVVWN